MAQRRIAKYLLSIAPILMIAVGAFLVNCSGDPRRLGNDTYECACSCGRCTLFDSFTGDCINFIVDDNFITRACADDDLEAVRACHAACNAERSPGNSCFEPIVLHGGRPFREGTCDLVGSSTGALLSAQSPTADLIGTVIPERSYVNISARDVGRGSTVPRGTVYASGGFCPGRSCPIIFHWVVVGGSPFRIGDHQVTGLDIFNHGLWQGTKLPDETYSINTGISSLSGSAFIDGTLWVDLGWPREPIRGQFNLVDLRNRYMTVEGTFTSRDGRVVIELFLYIQFRDNTVQLRI